MKDFVFVAKSLFEEKHNYQLLDDDDKKANFFRINQKCSICKTYNKKDLLKISSFFNKKDVDVASAMDLWFEFFKNDKTNPQNWWYSNAKNYKVEENVNNFSSYELIVKDKYNMSEEDLLFYKKYFKKELEAEVDIIKSYESKVEIKEKKKK